MFSQRDPLVAKLSRDPADATLNRPSSTILMQDGDKDTKRQIKKRFDLPNARSRDPQTAVTHSYKAKLNNPVTTSQKWKEQNGQSGTLKAGPVIHQRQTTPVLVQYQNALLKEKKKVSPFMVEGPELDDQQMTIEAHKTKKQLEDERALRQTQSLKQFTSVDSDSAYATRPKFSETLHTLKKLKQTEAEDKHRPPSSVFKKGTSDFLRRKMLSSLSMKQYDTAAY